MPGLLDHIAFLSQEIGPRPAGTEEEQQAALYITEQLQKEAGLSTSIEDFNSESNEEIPLVICTLAAFVFTILAIIIPIMALPAIVVAVIAALFYVLEVIGRPILSKVFTRGVSQNVVARYEPSYSSNTSARRRKIILMANYDSGKVQPELKSPLLGILPILQWAGLGAIVLLPIILLIQNLFFLNDVGGITTTFTIIKIIILVILALTPLLALIHKLSAYNEAANCNASGVAVLLDIAYKLGRGQVSSPNLETSDIYGEEVARASGLVPEGAELVYEAATMRTPEPKPQTEEERLASAKAAIAAMTGKPVPQREQSSIAKNLVQVKEGGREPVSENEMHEIREETRDAFLGHPGDGAGHQMQAGEAPAGFEQDTRGHSLAGQQGARAAEGNQASPESAGQAQSAGMAAVAAAPSSSSQGSAGSGSVPDWFKKAQENAKKPRMVEPKIQRSRYASALDAADAESAAHFGQGNKAAAAETEGRPQSSRDDLMTQEAAARMPQDIPERTPQVAPERVQQDALRAEIRETVSSSSRPMEASPEIELGGHTQAIEPINVDELRARVDRVRESDVRGDAQVQAQEQAEESQAKPSIVLPDISSSASLVPLDESAKQQRAPLAVAEEQSSEEAAKSLLNMLPSINLGEVQEENQDLDSEENTETDRSSLKTSLPSLSGSIQAQPKHQNAEAGKSTTGGISKVGAFAPAGATGSFAPVGDELLENVHPDDIYVEDADDSEYDGTLTETGAFAGPGYVDMPKSRARRFFDKFSFKKGKEDEETSTQEWLDVDEDFDARSIGAARGGWESFQKEDELRETEEDEWQGGAYSQESRGDESALNGQVIESNAFDGELDQQYPDELSQINQFKNHGLDTEVWFVLLGSELANNGGVKAFLAEHEPDLRGSIIINVSALAGGELSYIEKEGLLSKSGTSSRMKRYIQKAARAIGVSVSSAKMPWRNSASGIAAKQGLQAMSIMGMDGTKPSRYAQGDDILENIEEETLQVSRDFVMELLRSI